jgi:hypothetical protein
VLVTSNQNILGVVFFFVRDQVPAKWLAPESIFEARYNSASDVWGFGILVRAGGVGLCCPPCFPNAFLSFLAAQVWEVYSFGEDPYNDMEIQDAIRAVIRGYRMPRPAACPQDMYVDCVIVPRNIYVLVAFDKLRFVQIRRHSAVLAD